MKRVSNAAVPMRVAGVPTLQVGPPRSSAPVLVVGDLICDHYVWGDVERVSPEAPVQILRWEREVNRLGGAANVALNLAALDCDVRIFGVVGNDREGRWLVRTLRRHGVDTEGVVFAHDRPTARKTRVVARGQQLLRIDREKVAPLARQDERTLLFELQRLLPAAAGVICSDYAKGVLTEGVLAALIGSRAAPTGREAPRAPLVLVDPKGRDFSKYRGADVLTPNAKELLEATSGLNSPIDPQPDLAKRAAWLIRETRVGAVLVTRGAEGMDLFEADGPRIQHTHVPVLQRHEVYDVTGAGDTVAAVLGMALCDGLAMPDATRLANAAAGIVVATFGTAVVDRDALRQVMNGGLSPCRSKILSEAALRARVAETKARGARVVFTNGCFDLLHAGHLHLLQRSRALGDLLVVAVNDDASVRRLKGPDRPFISQLSRAEMLAALRFVDYVTLFSADTPLRLIRLLRPDVLVKGADYTISEVVGRDIVESYGGRVERIPALPEFSTASLVEAIRRRGVA